MALSHRVDMVHLQLSFFTVLNAECDIIQKHDFGSVQIISYLQVKRLVFFLSSRTTCYVLGKQPQGLLCSKWKLHECCITFTSSHEYLEAYSVLFCRTLGHWEKN